MIAAALLSVLALTDVRSVMTADLAQLQHSGTITISGEQICAERSLITFYARRANEPAWDAEAISALLRAIRRIREEGLDSAPYHTTAIESLSGGDPDTLARRDLLSSDAFLLLALHLTQGRVDPLKLIPEWCITPRRMDLAAVLQTAIDANDVEGVLARLAPHHDGYARLRSALAAYRAVAERGGWEAVSSGPPLRFGDQGKRVVELRSRLAQEPVVHGSPLPVGGDVFDPELAAGVRQFQAHHGLAVDGVAGGATIRELNVPAADRAAQIELNMERWRWMPEQLGESYALVNIAAFRLDVFEKSQRVLSMKTVAGKQFRETPFFPATIIEIVLNPSWYVPESIATEELWPKQQRDHSFFASQHIEVTPGGTLRQLPGPWNALGRIKFNMPNPFKVYLHDTPEKQLFSLQTRAFSHGCIRLERPMDLALYLLRDQSQWTRERLLSEIDLGTERTVALATPEPVYVLYWTAWAGDDGDVEFHSDVYGRDAQLRAALQPQITAAPPAGH